MLLQKSLTVASRQAPQRLAKVARGLSTWGDVAQGPADPILGLTQDFNNDTDPKVSVGAGAYRGEDGKPWVLPSVREVEQRILDAKMNHEYLPISGDADFVKCSLEFLYGADCSALAEGRVAGLKLYPELGTLPCRTLSEKVQTRHPNIFADAYLGKPPCNISRCWD